VASNPPPSGPGQPWPANPNDTPGTGYQTGNVPQQGQWPPPPSAATPPGGWAQPAPGQWPQQPAGAPQPPGAQPPGAQPPPGQWPARPAQNQWGQQPQQGQWPPTPATPPAGQPQNQWGQQPQQGGWPPPPAAGQPQNQWGQQPQQGGWPAPPPPGQPQRQWGPQAPWPPQQPPPNQWAPVVAQSGWAEFDPSAGGSDYPVDVRFTPEAPIGRYWGILWLGMWLRVILLIPHFIVLYFVGAVAFLATLLTWIPVLLTGRYPGWGYMLVGGYLRWALRVGAWATLLSGSYPSFTGAEKEGQQVRVRFDQERPIGRFWGIPVVGILIRYIILIPHFIVLWLLGIVVWILIVFAWIPVLFYGRQADLVYSVVGGWMRWYTRVVAYLLLLSGPYPPFRLD
jgi:Domain of unknown function (DUF4389)